MDPAELSLQMNHAASLGVTSFFGIRMGHERKIGGHQRGEGDPRIASDWLVPPWQRWKRIILKGDVLSPLQPPYGCRFHTRCPLAMDRCAQEEPKLMQVSPGHWTACWLQE